MKKLRVSERKGHNQGRDTEQVSHHDGSMLVIDCWSILRLLLVKRTTRYQTDVLHASLSGADGEVGYDDIDHLFKDHWKCQRIVILLFPAYLYHYERRLHSECKSILN